jgi:hypothetical protein
MGGVDRLPMLRRFAGLAGENTVLEPLGLQQEPRPAHRARRRHRAAQRDGAVGRVARTVRASTAVWTAAHPGQGEHVTVGADKACGTRGVVKACAHQRHTACDAER